MYFLCMEPSPSNPSLELIAQHLRRLGITQNDLSEALGVSQSQVSRVLSGKSSKRSKLLDRICSYAFQPSSLVPLEAVRRSDELIEALAATWDGTPEHARALASVIRSLGALARPIPRRRKT